VLLLDEPDASLDTEAEMALDKVLRQLKADGVTIIAVTHRSSLIDLADRLLRLRAGQMEQFGPPPSAQRVDNGSSVPAEVDLAMLRAGHSSLQAARVPTVEPPMGDTR
jgi:ATP-binding cassette subfamily C exporter for protease/lipase